MHEDHVAVLQPYIIIYSEGLILRTSRYKFFDVSIWLKVYLIFGIINIPNNSCNTYS